MNPPRDRPAEERQRLDRVSAPPVRAPSVLAPVTDGEGSAECSGSYTVGALHLTRISMTRDVGGDGAVMRLARINIELQQEDD